MMDMRPSTLFMRALLIHAYLRRKARRRGRPRYCPLRSRAERVAGWPSRRPIDDRLMLPIFYHFHHPPFVRKPKLLQADQQREQKRTKKRYAARELVTGSKKGIHQWSVSGVRPPPAPLPISSVWTGVETIFESENNVHKSGKRPPSSSTSNKKRSKKEPKYTVEPEWDAGFSWCRVPDDAASTKTDRRKTSSKKQSDESDQDEEEDEESKEKVKGRRRTKTTTAKKRCTSTASKRKTKKEKAAEAEEEEEEEGVQSKEQQREEYDIVMPKTADMTADRDGSLPQYVWEADRGVVFDVPDDLPTEKVLPSMEEFLAVFKPSHQATHELQWIAADSHRYPNRTTHSSSEEPDVKGLREAWKKRTNLARSAGKSIKKSDLDGLAETHNCRGGKWLLFEPSDWIDDAWVALVYACIAGKLGPRVKVALYGTDRPRPATASVYRSKKDSSSNESSSNDQVMCVYTERYLDEADVWRVRNEIESAFQSYATLHPSSKLCHRSRRRLFYKSDVATLLGLYSNNPYGVSPVAYSG